MKASERSGRDEGRLARLLGRRLARRLDPREEAMIAGAAGPVGCPTGVTYVNPLDLEPEGGG